MRVWLVAVAVLLAACSSEGDAAESPAGGGSSAASLPSCAEVWVDGGSLPEDYEGCARDDGSTEASVAVECDSGIGTFVTYRDEFFALLGGAITEAPSSSKAYGRVYEDCFADQ